MHFIQKPFKIYLLNMKKIALLLTLALAAQIAFAQSKNMNTARNHLNNYLNYDKAEGKTESLEKARTAIDAAVGEVTAMQQANDPKLKPKTVAKVYSYKAQIYGELAQLPNYELAGEAAKQAVDAAKTALSADKEESTLTNIQVLDAIRIKIFNAGIKGYESADYNTAYNSFKSATEISDILYANGLGGIDTSSIAMCAFSAQNAGKADEAMALYDRLIKLDYKDEQVYQQLAALYLAKGDDATAAKVIADGKAKFPNSNAFLISEINTLLKAGKQQDAIAKMEEAARLYPDNASLYFALGSTYEGLTGEGMQQKAESYYAKALEIKPDYFDALYNLGALFYNEAAEKIKQANELDLSKQKEYDKLSAAAKELFNKALPYFDKALAIDGNDLNTLIALKEIHANLGDTKKSNEYKARFDELKAKQ